MADESERVRSGLRDLLCARPRHVRSGSKRKSRLAAGCLLCPGERTSSGCLGMSEKCQTQTSQELLKFS
jgi:hypothetical protein